jgi:diadenosine tetraphosphatase ApaH/serine/threonine PP2A family protein phosphatase
MAETITDLLALDHATLRAELRSNRRLAESSVQSLFLALGQILSSEPNVLYLQSPLTVCGDIHGQLLDLFELFKVSGEDIGPHRQYLFLGDYVDRGYSSVETFAYLAYLKIKHPRSFFLLRGNHESRDVNTTYGLYNDVQTLYGHLGLWYLMNSIFDLLPIAAVIDRRIFCAHGGLSSSFVFIQQLSTLNRKREIDPANKAGMSPLETHAMVDLTWSDPDNVAKFLPNFRGKGQMFGPVQTRHFLYNNGLDRGAETEATDPRHGFVARSHQLVQAGWEWVHHGALVTVWSAPNYAYKSANEACVMKVERDQPVRFIKFEKDPDSDKKPDDVQISYFA